MVNVKVRVSRVLLYKKMIKGCTLWVRHSRKIQKIV